MFDIIKVDMRLIKSYLLNSVENPKSKKSLKNQTLI